MAEKKAGAALSSKILGLAFMKRAQEKKILTSKVEEAQQKDAEAHWVIEGAQSRCIVLTEGDPLPSSSGGASSGRFSFGGFNPAAERLAEAGRPAAAVQAAAGSAEAEADDAGGVTVTDADMATSLAQKQQRRQQQQQQHKGGSSSEKKKRGGGKLEGQDREQRGSGKKRGRYF